MTWRDRREWRASRIALRLLAFNVLVVFVPIVGILYLDVYEGQLLDAQERAMVQQARLLAATVGGTPAIDAEAARAALNRLGRRNDARLRVFDSAGTAVADSAWAADVQQEDELAGRQYVAPSGIRQRALYRLGAVLARSRAWLSSSLRRWLAPERGPGPLDQPGALDAELRAALAGRYGAATRRTWGQRSLTLSTAVPVRNGEAVIGAVVVSQSTYRILQALYDVRLRVFQIVVLSLAVAALLTTVAAMTIVTPVARLRRAAAAVSARQGPLPTIFPGTGRRDEIGELARALEDLTRRLTEHIALLEGFAADVSHEFKNPLAGIRSAAETIDACDDPAERRRFLALMIRDVERLERLVTGLRELVLVDQRLEATAGGVVDLPGLVGAVVEGAKLSAGGVAIVFTEPPARCKVAGDDDALAQVVENLLSNALSFAPAGSAVEVTVRANGGTCDVMVADRGPGIPEGHRERVFDRFFTYRPEDPSREHVGLGLAIARRIVERHGGTITAANRDGGGAVFHVRLPMARL